MKHIINTDTHLGRKNGNNQEIEQTSEFFDWLVDKAEENNITSFIHLGDWHHNRRSIPVPVISESLQISNKLFYQFTDIHILVGNHDMYYKDSISPNSLEIFNFLDTPTDTSIKIVDSLMVVDGILLVPWLIYDEDYEAIVNNKFDVKYAMGHLAINNIIMNRAEVRSKNEMLNLSDFKAYDKVLSGHYHQYGEYGNVIYIAAPYHMDFNDFGNRGIYIFDSDDGSLEFIEYTGAPKYLTLNAENYDKELIEGNNIKLEFYNNIGLNKINEIIDDVNWLGPNSINVSYKFTNTFTKPQESDSIEEIKSNREMLIDYLKESNLPSNLSIKVFKNIISTLES